MWRIGFRITLFEACSVFTHVATCILTKPLFMALYTGGFSRFVTSGVCQGSCRVSHFLSRHFILPLRVQIYRTDGCPIACAA
jgi:hypothetical protein